MALIYFGSGILLLSIFLFKYIAERVYSSALARVPSAHWTARFSGLWIAWKRLRGQEFEAREQLHRRLGGVVLIGPDELSVGCVDGVQVIYGKGFDKSSWYSSYFYFFGLPSLFSLRDKQQHARQKRSIWRPYAKSSIHTSKELQQIVHSVVQNDFGSQVTCWSDSGDHVDIFRESKVLVMKFISSFVFGLHPTEHVIGGHENTEEYMYAITHAVALDTAGYLKTQAAEVWNGSCKAIVPFLRVNTNSHRYLSEQIIWKLYQACISDPRGVEETSLIRERPCLHMKHNLKTSNESENVRERIVASEMYDHIIAGTETGGLSLAHAFAELSRHPHIQQELRNELRRIPNADKVGTHEARLNALETSPLLGAVVLETLRLHTPAKGPFPRVVPNEGSRIGSYDDIPAGTVVSIAVDYLHLDPETYKEPEKWDPYRWLVQDQIVLQRMHSAFWAFSSGPHMCIASKLVVRMLKEIIASVYTARETSIVNDGQKPQTIAHFDENSSDEMLLRFSGSS